MSILSIRNLSKSYGKTVALRDVSFTLEAGEILGFIGPNGAGKSTTMKCIAGLIPFEAGTIEILGHDIRKQRNDALAHLGLSIETPGLYPQLSGLDHLHLFGKLRGVDDARIEEMVAFSKLGPGIRRPAGTYSMGMKQRLALALALLTRPELLLLDEPTNGLDPGAIFTLRQELKQLRDDGIAILYSSHQLGELERICDRTVFIREGSIVSLDRTGELSYRSYTFSLPDVSKAKSLLTSAYPTLAVTLPAAGGLELRVQTEEEFSQVLHTLVEAGISVGSITENAMSLEERYASLYK